MSWLLPTAVVVVFGMLSAHATDNALVVTFGKGHAFRFKTEHLKKLRDCFCQEDNTRCVLLYTPVYSPDSKQGNKIQSQCQNTAFFECHFDADKIMNITCIRTLPSANKSGCDNCYHTCFTNTQSCDVSIIFHSQRNLSEQINYYNIPQDDCSCLSTGAQGTFNASSHAQKTTSIYALICLGIYVCIAFNVFSGLV